MLNAYDYCTHIYPLKITVGLSWGDNSIVRVDDGDDVHPEQLVECAVEVSALLLIVEVQVGHQNLSKLSRRCSRGEKTNVLGMA